MASYIEALEDLCEYVTRNLEESNDKIRAANGKLSASDGEYLKNMTGTLKNIKTIIAMSEAEDGEMSYDMGGSYRGGSYARGGNSYERDGGRSYARGRGRNARRDSMGRYSRERGYSYHDDMGEILAEVRGMMDELPEDKKRTAQRLIDELER